MSPSPRGHGGRDDGVHEHACLEQLTREHHRGELVALCQRDRDDRALGRVDRHAAIGEEMVEVRHVGTQLRAHLGRVSRRMRSPASAAATDPGVFDAVKMNGSASSVRSSIASAEPMTAPPHEPSVFEKVMVRRSTSAKTP